MLPWHFEHRLITVCWSQLKHAQLHTVSTEQFFSSGHLSQGIAEASLKEACRMQSLSSEVVMTCEARYMSKCANCPQLQPLAELAFVTSASCVGL